MEETFKSDPTSVLQVLCRNYMVSLVIETYLHPLEHNQANCNSLYCFEGVLTSPDQQLKKGVSPAWYWGLC